MQQKKEISAVLIVFILVGGFFIFKNAFHLDGNPNANTGAALTQKFPQGSGAVGLESIAVNQITETGATIVWHTKTPGDSLLEYGTSTKYDNEIYDKKYVTEHIIPISDLEKNEQYYFRVSTTNTLGVKEEGSATFRALTGGIKPEIVSLRITNITISNIQQNQATVSWTTNRPSDTIVDYGFDPSYGQTISNPALTVNHTVIISPLVAGRLYHFRLKSNDTFGYTAVSVDKNFTTMNPPGCPNTSTSPYEQSMYVWKENTLIITPGSIEQNDLFTYTDAKNIERIYLNANYSDLINPAFTTNLKAFLNTAWNQHCLKVEFLSGAGNWLAYPGNGFVNSTGGSYSTEATDWINAGAAFLSTLSGADARPVGFHADFEPHTWNDADWPGFDHYWNWSDANDNLNTVYAYLGALDLMKTAALPTGLPLVLDMPRWFDTAFILQNINYNNLSKNLMEHVYPKVDEVSIMDYVTDGGDCTTAGTICNDAENELDYGMLIGKPSTIVVETINVTGSGQTNGVNSFWTLTCADLTNALDSTYSNMSTSGKLPGFIRYAVHAFWDDNVPPPSGYKYLCP